jgi:hypothetical protein
MKKRGLLRISPGLRCVSEAKEAALFGFEGREGAEAGNF